MKQSPIENKNVKVLKLVGIDCWSRPVYEDQNGKLWKDVNLGEGEPELCNAANNEFEGEPDMPIKGEIVIEGKTNN